MGTDWCANETIRIINYLKCLSMQTIGCGSVAIGMFKLLCVNVGWTCCFM